MPSTASVRVPPPAAPADDPPPAHPPLRPLDQLAARCRAADLMVFRQVEPGRFVQLGGTGRGAGWAGNIELLVEAEAALRAALAGQVVRWQSPDAVPVLGPYHARSAALVPVDHDVVVLLGSGRDDVDPDDAVLRVAAGAAVDLVEAITPAKRLADELEVLAAVRATMQCTPGSLEDALRHVTRSAAEALGCELGIGWLPAERRLVVVERGWSLGADDAAVIGALSSLTTLTESVCRQDSCRDPLPPPLAPANGVRSHLLVPLAGATDGLLVLLHTVVTPRGFTNQCRTVSEHVAQAAGVVLQAAGIREQLVHLVAAAEHSARSDALTGLLNRLGWQEALDRTQPEVDGGAPAAVVVMDLNQLKFVNDRHGHQAGDQFLQRAADALRGAARDGDVVARLGGDEFAVLVPGAGGRQAKQLVERLRAALAAAEPVSGVALSAAVGAAVCPEQPTLRAAFRSADAAMYADKARTRAAS